MQSQTKVIYCDTCHKKIKKVRMGDVILPHQVSDLLPQQYKVCKVKAIIKGTKKTRMMGIRVSYIRLLHSLVQLPPYCVLLQLTWFALSCYVIQLRR